ncbi:putative manganese transporter [Salinibacter altiplanensis]|uniref:putative manganese transporter n=1 Tax=Salinibacter altiplanensis TaxID=1803181 RepID=UPI000C9F179C|nr:putative manganese transporter [Salinibacter altiplanensis]
MSLQNAFDILIVSIRDGFVQVSAFVAVTVLLFSYLQYQTDGRIVTFLRNHRPMQPIAGALLGLTPGCGGAIVAMPLYIRGTISFGSVVATLGATAGDSAFVILAIAPGAGVYAYGLAFAASVAFGYAIDYWGLGVRRIDAAVERVAAAMSPGSVAPSSAVAGGHGTATGPSQEPRPDAPGSAASIAQSHPARLDGALSPLTAEAAPAGTAPSCPSPSDAPPPHDSTHAAPTADGSTGVLSTVSHIVHLLWWGVAIAGLVAGVMYLVRGAPEVAVEVAPTFFGLFTVAGVTGTVLSFHLYFVGRHHMDEAGGGRIHTRFGSAYETFQHAAMETSMVTVWVLAGYLLYEYTMGVFALDLKALSAAAGVGAPLAGAALGLVPGCTPQIIFAQLYAVEEVIPFSALAANAVSQDGDALFPLMAIDPKAALVATIYTTIPAVVVGALVYYLWPFARFGFGVLG